MARYTSKSEFMHDFAAGATAHVSSKNVTQTYLNAEKRRQRKIASFEIGGITGGIDHTAQDKENKANGELFSRVARRIQKQNPGMSWIKARKYARTKDPTGRAVFNMMSAGSSNKEIRDKLHLGKKGSKPSIGKMGH